MEDEGIVSSRPQHVYDAKRMRSQPVHRQTVEFSAPLVRHLQDRVFQRDSRDYPEVYHHAAYFPMIQPTVAEIGNPCAHICSRFIRKAINKQRYPINVVTYSPEARRLITGAASGEFTLWNGLTFNFETILQAHPVAIRAMVWTHNQNWMVTADDHGQIKYWQSNMNNVQDFSGHNREPLRGLSFSITDSKFASCSDDGSVKIWDFDTQRCEHELTNKVGGHTWDVKCVAWHPYKSLVVSGSKDMNPIHKSAVLRTEWHKSGNLLLTASRDQLIKCFDLRMMKDLQIFRGHHRDVCSIRWHPWEDQLFASGGYDGNVLFWVLGMDEPQGEIHKAHESSIWALEWHPLGHILVTGSNDHLTKFWCRSHPGDSLKDKHNARQVVYDIEGGGADVEVPEDEPDIVPGLGGQKDFRPNKRQNVNDLRRNNNMNNSMNNNGPRFQQRGPNPPQQQQQRGGPPPFGNRPPMPTPPNNPAPMHHNGPPPMPGPPPHQFAPHPMQFHPSHGQMPGGHPPPFEHMQPPPGAFPPHMGDPHGGPPFFHGHPH
eukprot:c14935_g1_i2.p1 GENE.c14935_g1_i2~~c14935_g1_i2.p1  ORF type:complete len:553 (+),score=83.03 c14935_g1_i2:36-1661(+)